MADSPQGIIEKRKLQMKEIVTTENTESTEKREHRGERLQRIPLERHKPCGRQKFQALEVLEQEVPRFGNFGRKSSNVWKF